MYRNRILISFEYPLTLTAPWLAVVCQSISKVHSFSHKIPRFGDSIPSPSLLCLDQTAAVQASNIFATSC